MANINTDPTDKRISHHVSFEQGDKKIGLLLCDGRGNIVEKALQQGNMPRASLQIRQGDPDYSDLELPYTPITQKDWSGGRGAEDFEDDKSRYSDSLSVDTILGDVILGPKPVTALYDVPPTPISNDQQSSERFPNPYTEGAQIGHISLAKTNEKINTITRATRFQWTNALNLSQVKVWLANTNRIRVNIFKYQTIDLSTWTHQLYFDQACNRTWAIGQSLDGGNIIMVTSQDIAIPESTTLTEYTINLPAQLELNAYYVLAISSIKTVNGIVAEDFTIEPLFGVNNSPKTLEFQSIGGYFTLRIEGGSTTKPNGVWFHTEGTGKSLAYALIPSSVVPGGAKFFDYRGSLFLITSPLDATAPRLFMEGYHGFADNNSTDKTKIIALNVGAEAVGCVVKVVAGKGSTEEIRWRNIISVVGGGSGYCVVDRAWNIAHDTSTEYVIKGTGKWKEITGHTITKPVQSVMVVDDIVYFAQGEDTPIRRMRMVKSGANWAPEYANEVAENTASYLKLIQNENGKKKVWRAKATAVTVASSDAKTWGNNLDFDDDIVCNNKMFRITGIEAYGSPRIPWIMKEDGFGAVANNIYDQIPLAEFETVADDDNGRAHIQRGVYLYLSLLNGLERYYESRLDDIGPNRDKGLPNDRNGKISDLIAYPGRMYAAIDHPSGFSCVMAYNDIGWHEIYRSSRGARIYSMHVQVIDGDKFDRLWLAHEDGYTYLPIALDPKKQSDYQYNTSGEIQSAWISGGFKEIKKFLHSVDIFSEGLSPGEQYIRVSYQLDGEQSEWVEINEDVDVSPTQKILFSPEHNVSAQRFRIKLTLYTNDPTKTPRVKGITINPVTRLINKKRWTMAYRADDKAVDLNGHREPLSMSELMAQLEEWSSSEITPTPLLMHAPHTYFDSKYVFIESESVRPIEWVHSDVEKKMVAIGQLTIFEV